MKKYVIACAMAAFFAVSVTGCTDKKQVEDYTNKLDSISKSINDKEFNSAERQLEELLKTHIKDEAVKGKIQVIKDKLTTEKEKMKNESKITVAEKKEEGKVPKADETKESSSLSNKKKYIEKLNNIEIGLKDLESKYPATTIGMKQAGAETYKRWDDALNEIYAVLKQGLKADVMSDLKNQQIKWITYRDNTAKEESEQFKGGTMEGVQYIYSQGRITKERCYELVEKYLDLL